jgi:regulator of protease activity HflC (stomatin/prohibitin superfamily)
MSTGLLIILVLSGSTRRVFVILALIVAFISWLIVIAIWLTDRWRNDVALHLPDLRFPLFALAVTGIIILLARLLGKKRGAQTTAALMVVLWAAFGIGWLVAEWRGIFAITMPSLIIMIAGVCSLPRYVLPVVQHPWKWPVVAATLYTFLWLAGLLTDRLAVNLILYWVYLQGFLLLVRPAFPLTRVRGFVPLAIFVIYGCSALVAWRGFDEFELTTFNMLILTQGLLTLSVYGMPVQRRVNALALTGLAVVYGLGYGAVIILGEIGDPATNRLILLLGLLAFVRFGFPTADSVKGPRAYLVTILVKWFMMPILMMLTYCGIWFVGGALGELEPLALYFAIVFTGLVAILIPPLLSPARHWEAFKAIITYNLGTNYPYKAVKGRKLVTRAEGSPYSQVLAGPGIVLTDADHAIVVYRGGRFNRVSSPGLIFTFAFEEAMQAVDLRPQLRTTSELTATTKDGIEVTVDVFCCVQTATDGRKPELGRPFPYDPVAVARAVHAQRVGQDTHEIQGWDRLVSQACERAVRDIIAEYSLDELTNLDSPRDPRTDIANRMIDDVRVQMQQQDWGLELVFGTIGSISPSQDVIQKRVDDWKARRESELDTLEAEAAAVEIHWTEQARATAHVELFRTIIEGLDLAAKLQPEDTRKLMAFQLLEAIERLGTSDPDLADRDTSAIRVIRRRLQ